MKTRISIIGFLFAIFLLFIGCAGFPQRYEPIQKSNLPKTSQADDTVSGCIGIKAIPFKQYVKISYCYRGAPADIAGLMVGDRIFSINGQLVSELSDPLKSLTGAPGTWVILIIHRFGKEPFEVNVPLINTAVLVLPLEINATNWMNYPKTEADMLEMLQQWCPRYYLFHYLLKEHLAIEVLHDPDRDMFQYKTYDFDYSSVENPLLEKELFSNLGKLLDSKGMKRSTEKPDLLIVMSFYSGKKEQYVQPQQIVSTHVQNVWRWGWGNIPMPITESHTEGGYTQVTYLASISLKFLDFHDMENKPNSKVPPVVWSGSISQSSDNQINLPNKCSSYFSFMMEQFPYTHQKNISDILSYNYPYTGLWFDTKNISMVSEVNPGSPASIAGIQKGDKILKVNGYIFPSQISDLVTLNVSPYVAAYYSISKKIGGFSYLFMYQDVLQFVIKRNRTKMTFTVKPEKRNSLIFY